VPARPGCEGCPVLVDRDGVDAVVHDRLRAPGFARCTMPAISGC
jgi:hypothetical protein